LKTVVLNLGKNPADPSVFTRRVSGVNPYLRQIGVVTPEAGQTSQSKRVSRYLPPYRIEGQKEDENGAASPFLLLKSVSDDVDWPHNDNRVHGKRYRRMNGRH